MKHDKHFNTEFDRSIQIHCRCSFKNFNRTAHFKTVWIFLFLTAKVQHHIPDIISTPYIHIVHNGGHIITFITIIRARVRRAIFIKEHTESIIITFNNAINVIWIWAGVKVVPDGSNTQIRVTTFRITVIPDSHIKIPAPILGRLDGEINLAAACPRLYTKIPIALIPDTRLICFLNLYPTRWWRCHRQLPILPSILCINAPHMLRIGGSPIGREINIHPRISTSIPVPRNGYPVSCS